jgi:hypothetical protein
MTEDLEQLRRETERLQAECANALAKDQLYRLKRDWRQEVWYFELKGRPYPTDGEGEHG